MDPAHARLLRQLPQVDELLRHPHLIEAVASLPRPLAAAAVCRGLAELRQFLSEGPAADLPAELDPTALVLELQKILEAAKLPSLRRVLNATGVVMHTNLGRSPLAAAALAQIQEVAVHYSTLEYDLNLGQRGSRQDHLEVLLQELTGAEAALVVNNNAAAVLLALTSLAQEKRSSSPGGNWWRSAAPSACRRSWRPAAPSSGKWAPPTRRTSRTMSRPSVMRPPCC